MSAYTGRLVCVRCGVAYPEPALELIGAGCPACVGANVLPEYDISEMSVMGGPGSRYAANPGVPLEEQPSSPRDRAMPGEQPSRSRGRAAMPLADGQPGLFRYRALLPLSDDVIPVSLGEGGTPVISLPNVAESIGVRNVWVKDESRNPTWSYKDRLAAVATTKAVELSAGTVVVASTGNHGAAVAAYAARAGLRCIVLTLASVPATMKTLMQAYGAEVVALPTPADRWRLMGELVRARGWMAMSGYADPPAGSHPYGVDGYKTIAYELIEQLPEPPGAVVVPVAYGDGLSGIARGFADLAALGIIERVPRMIAAEPFGPLAQALATGAETAGPVPVGPSVAFSTASPFGTQQSLAALRGSNGTAIATPDNDEIMAEQLALAAGSGLYLEASSVTAVLALRKAGLGPDETAVVIGTSSGLKDVGATAARLAEVPVIEPTIVALDKVLR